MVEEYWAHDLLLSWSLLLFLSGAYEAFPQALPLQMRDHRPGPPLDLDPGKRRSSPVAYVPAQHHFQLAAIQRLLRQDQLALILQCSDTATVHAFLSMAPGSYSSPTYSSAE